jgi:hypothetical protein
VSVYIPWARLLLRDDLLLDLGFFVLFLDWYLDPHPNFKSGSGSFEAILLRIRIQNTDYRYSKTCEIVNIFLRCTLPARWVINPAGIPVSSTTRQVNSLRGKRFNPVAFSK